MQTAVFPCLCGFACERQSQMRRHRRQCETWQDRPDPKGLTKERRASRRPPSVARIRCEECGGRPDHHIEGCSQSLEAKARRQLVERHGIDFNWFQAFLRILAKRYETGRPWRS